MRRMAGLDGPRLAPRPLSYEWGVEKRLATFAKISTYRHYNVLIGRDFIVIGVSPGYHLQAGIGKPRLTKLCEFDLACKTLPPESAMR
jgi:hypothetical protein